MSNVISIEEWKAKKEKDAYLERVMEARLIRNVFPNEKEFERCLAIAEQKREEYFNRLVREAEEQAEINQW